MTTNKVIKETEDYIVIVSRTSQLENPVDAYVILNKDTGVREVEATRLPVALMECEFLQKELDEIRNPKPKGAHYSDPVGGTH